MPASENRTDGTFTVDVEDYFHVSAFSSRIQPSDWDQYECRVVENTHHVLNLAAEAETTGTFFVLGWVAKRYPELVKAIQHCGHEIGCHSQQHQLVYDLGPEKFRADLIESRDLLQDITGTRVVAYRSPSFSITRRSLWALDILAEEGFETDSSIYPIRHDRYGIPDAPLRPYLIHTSSGPVREFPGTVAEVRNTRVPVGGGGYLRLFPWRLTEKLLDQIRVAGRPLNIYVHPWEFDVDQPRVHASLKSRFRHYQNLGTTTEKVRRLLNRYQLTTMSTLLDAADLEASTDAVSLNAASITEVG